MTMKENFSLSLVGEKIELVPYRKKFVPRYHEWMEDDYILQMTASERLSLEEEYEMQQSWKDDPSKCTFIVLQSESAAPGKSEFQRMVGDVNLFIGRSLENGSCSSEINVMIAESNLRRCGLGREAVEMLMWYGHVHLNISTFFAKISKENQASIRLFERYAINCSFIFTESFIAPLYAVLVMNSKPSSRHSKNMSMFSR